MQVSTAQIPGPAESQDRVVVTDHMALVLDGASAFEPVDVPTGLYVDLLGEGIRTCLDQQPDIELATAVASAIEAAAQELQLKPGNAPSSTVSLLRVRDDGVDLLSLGDSAIYYGNDDGETGGLTDSRLANLGIPEHRAYRNRVAAGHGYDARHRELLADLQREQRKRRNRPEGYWIAEAEPDAANHALALTVPRGRITWAVLATDGAYGPMFHLGLADWKARAHEGASKLEKILKFCEDWERHEDPDGRKLPRAKVSDDKTLAAVLV
ncbi:protein phosphatase 2C domain-containing protein [Amycolatopsis sp. FDAARGOS 1241]|uniref:protein phosphatase 2C domain-containing protein n=1 Tax=Amycolatopsis sp. FDAARGOS 1241 TaxID=2778070 RepID=UPI001EF1EF56|nr:protein phosphatase 2C domain-containing protein [Amycolatopsis sp. FDAARGOS 1241]